MKHESYKRELRHLQIELVKFQRHLIKHHLKILIIFEGRDGAGKDGIIKRITEHLSPRDTRIVALGKPSDYESRTWYFQRYVAKLPATEEMVVMNRSWYNRAGVEKVMGFCTAKEYETFMQSVVPFEELLVAAGIQIIKYYLDIDKPEQDVRLKRRKNDPLLQWKESAVDDAAIKHWQDYSEARNQMLIRTTHLGAPWYVVKANDKKAARINVLRHLLSCIDCPGTDPAHRKFNKDIVFQFSSEQLQARMLAE